MSIVKNLENTTIKLFDSVALPYHQGRNADVWKSLWKGRNINEFSSNDWYAVLDADEFIVKDPRPVLVSNEYVKGGVNKQCVVQVHSFLTEDSLLEEFDGKNDIREHMKYFAMDFKLSGFEPRFFRCEPNPEWPSEPSVHYPRGLKIPPKCCLGGWKIILNRHFPYRSLQQVKKRYATRNENGQLGGRVAPQWINNSKTWSFLRKQKNCLLWDEKLSHDNIPLVSSAYINYWSFSTKISTLLRNNIPVIKKMKWFKRGY